MLNSRSSELDHILSLGKAIGDHVGLSYTGIRFDSKIIFVQAINSFNPQEAKKQKLKIPNMKFEEKSLKRKWNPRWHYCNHQGHIRLHYFTYLEDLRKKSNKNIHSYTIVRKKSNKNIHSYTIGMIKEEEKFGAQLKRESMLKPTILHKRDLRKMVNDIRYQARWKRNGKFVKKPMLDKMSNNVSQKIQ